MKRLLLALALLAATGAHALDGPRRVIINGNVPNWVTQNWGSLAPLISWDYDFQHNRCYIQGAGQVSCDSILSTSRASNAICAQNNGTLISVGSNTRCWTDQGLLIQEARTNKCTNYNANPTDTTNVTKSGDAAATLTVVDDTAALAAAGLQNIATSGKVYKLDNSAGGAVAVATITSPTGNTNPHIASTWGRVTGTAGANRIQIAGVASSNFTSGAAYGRTVLSFTPSNAFNQVSMQAVPGAVVYFILTQLEEGAFVTSPIVVAGSSAARAADVISLTGQAATNALAAKAAFFQTKGVAGLTTYNLLLGSTIPYFHYPSTTIARATDNVSNASATIGSSGTTAGTVKFAVGIDSTSLTAVANNGTKATVASAISGLSGTLHLGNTAAGTRALNGYMQRFAGSAFKGLFDNSTRVQ